MALKIFEKFSPRANPADADYPFGSIKNESVPGAKDGTPLDASWGNDMLGFTDALLDDAGITPNGLPDTVQSSQRLGALKTVVRKPLELKIFQSPTDNLTKVTTFAGGVGVVYEVRKTSDNSLATIYSDKDGVTSIPQNGTANVSNGDAEVVFYIADGDYTVTIDAVNETFSTDSKDCTVSDITSGLYSVGSRLTVTDRADGIFNIVSGGTPNGFDILDAGGGSTAVLEYKNGFRLAEQFGVKYDGTETNDAWQRFWDYADENLRTVYVGYDGDLLITAERVVPAESTVEEIVNRKVRLQFGFSGTSYPTDLAVMLREEKPIDHYNMDFSVHPSIALNFSRTPVVWDGSGVEYSLLDYTVGVFAREGAKFYRTKARNVRTPMRVDGGFDDTLKTVIAKSDIQECGGGAAGVANPVTVFSCSNVDILDNFGRQMTEWTFPSVKNIKIDNNILVAEGVPTIDVGGSGVAGFQTEKVIITNNISTGRDPIVCERGSFKTIIDNNICIVTATQATSSGVGIGVTDQSDSNQGVSDVMISNSQISLINDPTRTQQISANIRVTIDSPASSSANRIKVFDNNGTRAFYGLQAQGQGVGSIEAYDNTFPECFRGILATKFNKGIFNNNDIVATASVGAGGGAYFLGDFTEKCTVDGGDIRAGASSYSKLFVLSGDVSKIRLRCSDLSIPNAGYLFNTDLITSGNVFFNITDSILGSTSALNTAPIARGSRWEIENSSAGGFAGRYCVTAAGADPVATPPVFKGFSQIEA